MLLITQQQKLVSKWNYNYLLKRKNSNINVSHSYNLTPEPTLDMT